jgi:GNAT superfamily N-acetyltransferase
MRAASMDDYTQLVALWGLLFGDDHSASQHLWTPHAHAWFARFVGESDWAYFPVIQINGTLVATAIGTLGLGVPNPHCLRGRTVQLANLITLPDHRGNGYATQLVRAVIDWARAIEADRVDLSATPEGQGIYDKAGFVLTTAPRMKLILTGD